MRLKGVEENRFMFFFVFKVYVMKFCDIGGRMIYGKVLKMGFDCDVFINNVLMNLYFKCCDINSVCNLFDEMFVVNVVNWNMLIVVCLNCGDLESVCKMFDEMFEKSVDLWNVVIVGYCKLC